jgi:hypothetical protein
MRKNNVIKRRHKKEKEKRGERRGRRGREEERGGEEEKRKRGEQDEMRTIDNPPRNSNFLGDGGRIERHQESGFNTRTNLMDIILFNAPHYDVFQSMNVNRCI